MSESIPGVIADDAPVPDEFPDGATVRTPGRKLWDVVAVSYDGVAYCLDCASDGYVELAKTDPHAVPYGGPISRSAEFDHRPACDHCHRSIADVAVLHPDK